MMILDLHKVKKVFGIGETAVTAVNDIDLEVKKGEIVLIMGPSGSGKTTLLSIAGGILHPTEGEVKIKGKNITRLSEEELPKVRLENIGFIFQSFNLLASLTALENVEVAAWLGGNKDAAKKAAEVLSVLGLKDRLNNLPADLSGGEKQRVAIARALVNDPEIVLADEPTANLDSKMGHEVVMQLKKIAKDHNKSVLIVSHDNRIRDIADRVLWLEDGKFKELAKMVIDPVCGMSIEKRDYKYLYKDKEFYFCSPGCMKEFKGNVDQYPNTSTL